MEECAEVLRVGVVCAVFSPDVVHRLELFLTAFRESVKMTPPMSAGIYLEFMCGSSNNTRIVTSL